MKKLNKPDHQGQLMGTVPPLQNCPLCGARPYFPTQIKKNRFITSCTNQKCVLCNVKVPVKNWNYTGNKLERCKMFLLTEENK